MEHEIKKKKKNLKNQIVNLKLEKAKGLIFPLLAIILFILFIFTSDLKELLFGFTTSTNYFNYNLSLSLSSILIIISIIILLLISEFFSQILIKLKYIDVSDSNFIRVLNKRDYYSLYFVYPLTLLFEELFFRGLIYYFFSEYTILSVSSIFFIFLSAIIFSFYHIHIYFTSKNIKLTVVYIIFSFLLGLILAYAVFQYGIFGCWIIHLLIVTYTYLRWNRLISDKKKKK